MKHGGKSGGIRLIFYHHPRHDLYYFLYLYEKSAAQTLTSEQKDLLRDLITTLKKALES